MYKILLMLLIAIFCTVSCLTAKQREQDEQLEDVMFGDDDVILYGNTEDEDNYVYYEDRGCYMRVKGNHIPESEYYYPPSSMCSTTYSKVFPRKPKTFWQIITKYVKKITVYLKSLLN